MTIYEFCFNLDAQARAFSAYWISMMESDLENYKENLPEGDWWEQFITWVNQEED